MAVDPSQDTTSADARSGLVVAGPRRLVYLALAAVFFGLAVLGALLPVLPTTPFLLVTSFLLVRSSPALNERLLRSRVFGLLLEDWRRHRAVRPQVKVISIAASLTAVALSALYGNLPPLGLASLGAVALAGLVVVMRLPVTRG
jgi:hypothetical protein